MATFLDPVEVTPGSSGAFTDVDVSASVPSGAVGVILHVVNTAAGEAAWGIRKNGSSDDRTTTMQATDHQWACIGVDANRVFEANVASTTTMDIYLVGYFTDQEAFFLTNATDKSTGTTGSFQDVDITADKDASHSGETAIAAFFEVSGGTTANYGVRKNGSTDSRLQDNAGGQHVFGVIGLDAGEIFEQQIANVAIDLFLNGYLFAEGTFHTNATVRSTTTTGSYVDMGALGANAVGGVYEGFSASSTNTHAFRKNGSTEDIYPAAAAMKHAFAVVECDASQVVEQKISGTGQDCFEIGYFTASPAGGGDATLTATAAVLALSSPAATLAAAVTRLATACVLALSAPAPTVSAGTSTVAATTNVIGLSAPAPTINRTQSVTANVLAVSAPSVTASLTLPVAANVLALSAQTAAPGAGAASLVATTSALALSAPAAVASVSVEVAASTVALSAPQALASAGTATLSASADVVALSAGAAAPSGGAVAVAADASTVSLSAGAALVSVSVEASASTIALSAPTAAVAAGANSAAADTAVLAISAPAAAVAAGEASAAVAAAVVAVSAPDAVAAQTVTLAAATLALSAPDVAPATAVTLEPGTAHVALSAPTAVLSSDSTATVDAAVLAVSAPTAIAFTPLSPGAAVFALSAPDAVALAGAVTLTATADVVAVTAPTLFAIVPPPGLETVYFAANTGALLVGPLAANTGAVLSDDLSANAGAF